MSFERTLLPDAVTYHTEWGASPSKGAWFSRDCFECGSSDGLRTKKDSGAFVCMACGVKGGDVLAYHMQRHGLGFVEAAKQLGCWVADGRPAPKKPAPFSARDALHVTAFEVLLIAVAGENVANGSPLSDEDRTRVRVGVNRIRRIAEAFQ